MLLIEGKTIGSNIRFIPETRYIDCIFVNQSFEEEVFTNCEFENCTFSSCFIQGKTFGTSILVESVTFEECKVLGVQFNPYIQTFGCEITSKQSDLSYSAFTECIVTMNAISSCFNYTQWQGIPRRSHRFESCTFEGALFHNTDLSQTQFSNCSNVFISMENNKVKGMKWDIGNSIEYIESLGVTHIVL